MSAFAETRPTSRPRSANRRRCSGLLARRPMPAGAGARVRTRSVPRPQVAHLGAGAGGLRVDGHLLATGALWSRGTGRRRDRAVFARRATTARELEDADGEHAASLG